MRQAIVFLAGVVLAGASWAHNCPNEMKAIDAKLGAKPALAKDAADKVAKLRASGEVHHKAGRHNESMRDLGEAKKLLGM